MLVFKLDFPILRKLIFFCFPRPIVLIKLKLKLLIVIFVFRTRTYKIARHRAKNLTILAEKTRIGEL